MSTQILLILRLIQFSLCSLVDTTSTLQLTQTKSQSDKWKCPPERPVVFTRVGAYCGIREVVHWPDGMASKVDIFYGIRYAQAPIGPLRFHKPVAPRPEPNRVFSANELPASCSQPRDTMFQDCPAARMWQVNTPMSEDCLFLNIWVPSAPLDSASQPNEKLAVMLWIYGGSFYMGTSSLSVYEGRFLAARQNIIVASMNYRVGPFGFLYTESADVPGNMGLWDQRMAMKWIKDNIDSFGGDPERITLFGESAGAVSVSAHVISPWSHSHFTNAIMQSGTIYGNWALVTNAQALNRTARFTQLLGCNSYSLVDRISCLRKKSAVEILDAHDAMFDPSSYFFVPFPPVLDNHFLPYENGQRLRQMSHLKPTGTLMYGMNKNEGSYFLLYAFVKNGNWKDDKTQLPITSREEYLQCLRKVLDLDDDADNRPELTEPLIRYTDFEYETYEYTPSLALWTQRLEAISSDRSFKCPTIRMASAVTSSYRFPGRRRSPTLPVYFYEFRHRTQSVQWPEWTGTMHGYEIEYVFGIPFSPQFQATYYRFTDEERQLSDMIMTYWANFARTGDPNVLPQSKHVMDVNQPPDDDRSAEPNYDAKVVLDYLSRNRLPHSLSKIRFMNWPEYRNQTNSYIIFDEEPGHILMGLEPKKRQCTFWHRLYPAMLQQIEMNRRRCEARK
ncbi:unnamed protein product [Dicrocoelium dendriticum]|nr:unnamed protein product [Dicrocoelium dendriticum]